MKVEINGKTYCVETLIYTVERLTKDVKANAEYHRLILDKIKTEIESLDYTCIPYGGDYVGSETCINRDNVIKIIDKYKAERSEE